jgi:hypothetical protein
MARGSELIRADKSLKEYVADRKADIKRVSKDWEAITAVVDANGWDVAAA